MFKKSNNSEVALFEFSWSKFHRRITLDKNVNFAELSVDKFGNVKFVKEFEENVKVDYILEDFDDKDMKRFLVIYQYKDEEDTGKIFN
jgi:hypothetical protein